MHPGAVCDREIFESAQCSGPFGEPRNASPEGSSCWRPILLFHKHPARLGTLVQ